jgi:hypothetical protein
MVRPRYGDGDESQLRWRRWRQWLRGRRLSGVSATIASIDPLGVAKRVEHMERRHWSKREAREGRRERLAPRVRLSGALDTHFLEKAFGWLTAEGSGLPDPTQQSALFSRFWAHLTWYQRGSADEKGGEFKVTGQFGYALAWAMARLATTSTMPQAVTIWTQVFALGPRGHYAISAFLSQWFMAIKETTDHVDFGARWRELARFVLTDPSWASHGRWYRVEQLEREVLGLTQSIFIARSPGHAAMVSAMRDLYKMWAMKRLPSDQDNLEWLCAFLSSAAGRVLRLEGLQWIADAMRRDEDTGKWYRASVGDNFMALLETAVLEDTEGPSREAGARQALVALAAHAVARQLPRALSLQDRVRQLR